MSTKSAYRHRIIVRQLGNFVEWTPLDPPPLLTNRYAEVLQDCKDQVRRVIDGAELELKSLKLGELREAYDQHGRVIDATLKPAWDSLRERAGFLRRLPPIYLAGLGNPHYAADYRYWSRMEWLKVDEALWLSVGFDPRVDWSKALAMDAKMPPKEHREREHMRSMREQLDRFARSSFISPTGFKGPELLDWISAVRFPAHPGFLDALKAMKRRRSSELEEEPDRTAGETDPRAVVTVAKLLTAIAIEEYGYKPNSRRSPIPKEIEGISDRHGLSVSKETILKYLRLGASHLPKDD